jgi:hypothetical protein
MAIGRSLAMDIHGHPWTSMDIHGDGYMMYDIPVKTSIWDEVAMVAMKLPCGDDLMLQ